MHFTLYDSNAARIVQIEKNLQLALKALGLKGTVLSISEPPLLAREQLLSRVPLVEYQQKRWSLSPGKTPSKQEFIKLLTILTTQEM